NQARMRPTTSISTRPLTTMCDKSPAAWSSGALCGTEECSATGTSLPDPINLAVVQLSRREHEVAALVAKGLTDLDISRRLSMSERAVDGYVEQIRIKLNLDTRSQITTWVGGRSREPSEMAHAGRASLPVQLNSFVGRQRELRELEQLLQRTRLLTLTG